MSSLWQFHHDPIGGYLSTGAGANWLKDEVGLIEDGKLEYDLHNTPASDLNFLLMIEEVRVPAGFTVDKANKKLIFTVQPGPIGAAITAYYQGA